MASTQDIRRRIKTVHNIEQITKAMKMVAVARLRKAQERANASLPFTEKIRQVVTSVAQGARGDASHPLLTVRDIKRSGYVILSSDKGLAGAYASNLIKEALGQMTTDREQAGLVTVGRKARDYFRRRGYTVDKEFTGFSERPAYDNAVEIAGFLTEGFIEGRYDEIYLIYTLFHSPLVQEPSTLRLLPLEPEAPGTAGAEYLFEPSSAEVLGALLPKYLETVVYGALLQSAASELGARMTAMESATDNAEELISKLTLNYNKVRQASITREITEIVGGAEALK